MRSNLSVHQLSRSVLLAVCLTSAAFAQFDFTGNGAPDILLQSERDHGSLSWSAQDVVDLHVRDLGGFGRQGDSIGAGLWLGIAEPQLALVRRDERGQFDLIVQGSDRPFYIGDSLSKSVVSIGRDINGSSWSDAVLVSRAGPTWSWRFTFDPFVPLSYSRRRILFGAASGIPFLFRRRGNSDVLALLRTRKKSKHGFIVFRHLTSKRVRKIRVHGFALPRERPQVIGTRNRPDRLLFQTRRGDGSLLTAADFRGRKINAVLLPNGTSALIYDFSGDGRQTIGSYTPEKKIEANNRIIPILLPNAQPFAGDGTSDHPQEVPGHP